MEESLSGDDVDECALEVRYEGFPDGSADDELDGTYN